jgi:hypothetical protein
LKPDHHDYRDGIYAEQGIHNRPNPNVEKERDENAQSDG